MILYHPATDFYHCWMRFASLLIDCDQQQIEFDRIRIIDFLFSFPSEIQKVQLPLKHSSKVRKSLKDLPKHYEDPNSYRRAFDQMSSIHSQVATDMAAKGVIDTDTFKNRIIIPNENHRTEELLRSVAVQWKTRNADWYTISYQALLSIELNGKRGLKARTGLIEHQYDE